MSNANVAFYSFQWAQASNETMIEPIIQYDDRELFQGRLAIEDPFETKIREGKILYDIAHFEDPFNFSILERVHRLLKNAAATGWKGYDIVIKGIEKKYFCFVVTSDFFCTEGTFAVMCTERIKNILIKNKITNLKLGRIDTIQWYST